MPEKIPDECPDITTCQETLLQEEYENFCETGMWIYCKQLSAKTKRMLETQFKQKPSGWKKHGVKG